MGVSRWELRFPGSIPKCDRSTAPNAAVEVHLIPLFLQTCLKWVQQLCHREGTARLGEALPRAEMREPARSRLGRSYPAGGRNAASDFVSLGTSHEGPPVSHATAPGGMNTKQASALRRRLRAPRLGRRIRRAAESPTPQVPCRTEGKAGACRRSREEPRRRRRGRADLARPRGTTPEASPRVRGTSSGPAVVSPGTSGRRRYRDDAGRHAEFLSTPRRPTLVG